MVPRYVTRPARAYIDDDGLFDFGPLIPDLTVDDHEPIWTGLLDADGEPIMRLPNPIGFGRDDEWGAA